MSTPDGERIPQPDESIPEFDFGSLTADVVEPISEFTEPDTKATRSKWWERKPKTGTTRTGNRSRRTPKPAPTMPRGGLKGPLENVYTGIGMSILPFDPGCGRIIIENAGSCAAALDELAKTNPAVRRVLMSLVTTSALGAVVMAHAPIVMAIAMHHVPALRDRQEKMVGEFAEMMANGFADKKDNEES